MQYISQLVGNKISSENIKSIMIFGFGVNLVLITLLGYTALTQLRGVNQDLEEVVKRTNTRIAAAYTMRDAIRKRALILRDTMIEDDVFVKDENTMEFSRFAGEYRSARDKIVVMMNEDERDIHNRLSELTKVAQPLNDRAMDLMLQDSDDHAISEAIELASSKQSEILGVLDELVSLEERYADQARNAGMEKYDDTKNIMLVIILLTLLLGLVSAVLVIRIASHGTRKMHHQATHDSLTGLINRREVERRIDEAITIARNNNEFHAFLYLDLDNFKVVNDSCGHAGGDALLKEISSALKEHVRKSDVAARLGGDEFGILLHDCRIKTAAQIAEKIRNYIEEYQFRWEGKAFGIGVSIGIVAINTHTQSMAQLLKDADNSCYTAKRRGKNRIYIFSTSDDDIIKQESEIIWVNKLKDAFDTDGFELHAQPIVSLDAQDQFKRSEILIRLKEENGELSMPGSFIPAAERYYLMPKIDRWIIDNLFALLADEGSAVPENHYYFINLSGLSVSDVKFIEYLEGKLGEYPEIAVRLCFEITETAAIANLEITQGLLESLKKHQCKVALDDFGVGMSSLFYLKHLPVDYVKIDGGFVQDMLDDKIDYEAVRLINEFCHTMDIETIAESVEHPRILDELEALSVDYVQGYALGYPEPLLEYVSVD